MTSLAVTDNDHRNVRCGWRYRFCVEVVVNFSQESPMVLRHVSACNNASVPTRFTTACQVQQPKERLSSPRAAHDWDEIVQVPTYPDISRAAV